MKNSLIILLIITLTFSCVAQKVKNSDKGLFSIETGYTISKVSIAKNKSSTYIVASSFEGTVLGISYSGNMLWKNELSGFINHDVWCDDINADGIDEILIANADGTIYCIDSKGNTLWSFKKNDAPMYAVSVINNGKESFVVAGGFDKLIYYLSSEGKEIKAIHSNTFSIEKPWSYNDKLMPKPNECTANFIRPLKKADGSEVLVVLGSNNHMNVPGTLYFFNPLEDQPYNKVKIHAPKELKKKIRIRPLGDFKTADLNNDGNEEIILGSSSHVNDILVSIYDTATEKFNFNRITNVKFGYDIAHNVTLNSDDETLLLTRVGSQMRIYNPNNENEKEERLISKFAYNDMCKDEIANKIILASAQSGGSQIHVINPETNNWKKAFKELNPNGKIKVILKNTKAIEESLRAYEKPITQNNSQPVYLMTEKIPASREALKSEIDRKYKNPIFLNSTHMNKVEKWDRSILTNDKYRKARDRRKKYVLNHQEAFDQIMASYTNQPGVAYWAGHGNDPYMFSKFTTQKVIDNAQGKKTVLIYPEVEDHNPENLDFLVNDLIYPLAKYAQGKNTNIFLRSKNVFWLGSNYLSSWSPLMSGEFADVFVPSMEETTDKSMELSLAGRMGIWASGSVNSWGTRAVPDNVSIDRARQIGYQRLPNHFLRMLVFHTANGAQFINNFAVDQEYLSIYWELIAKGALYVPKRNEILSISPVHISMKEPDHHFLDDGANVKWTTFFDEDYEKNNPFVISRLNGTWPGAPVNNWDFSKYAAGVKERRLNFLAPYQNGLVLITPVQEGVFAQQNVSRDKLANNLHPLYKSIMKEYITDGRNYYSADGKEVNKADEYYKTIEADIIKSSKKLPLTVSGDVAWVVAQISPKTLRLTIIDNEYINPQESSAKVHFNTINPKKIIDVLNKEEFNAKDSTVNIDIPLGSFRFLDIELDTEL
ncbi:WD40 repeat domain-containing protein [uncultured Algibacter sp.]|uniref:WD40 repeat domain-containing protein n=1 Tax=uncultured Algibacter sp. TaxID=298659 RepID=UPI00260B4DD4|nr:WD40 repeat domain-containing protein [uncultured Algibacter sp.]